VHTRKPAGKKTLHAMTDFNNDTSHTTTPPSSSPSEERTSVDQPAVITPLKVTIPKEKEAGLGSAHTYNVTFALIVVSFVLVMVGLWLFGYLSKNPVLTPAIPTKGVVPPQGESTRAETLLSEPNEPHDQIQVAREKEKAEEALADFTLAQHALEVLGVSHWGGERYDRMRALSKAADKSLMEKEYRAATLNYQEALALARELSDGADDVLARLLNEGERTLRQGEGERAQELFGVALMIDPENSFARHNLERAKNSKKVAQLIVSGKGQERKNNLARAHAAYQEALQLDPESEEARDAFNRIAKVITDEQFQKFMSEGLSALHRNDYTRARSLFLEAQSFKPDSREVKDALFQVDEAIRLARIEELRTEARAAEKAEKWNQAQKAYLDVLKIEGTIQFALEGRERSQKRQQMEARMQQYIQKPHLLESDRMLALALQLAKEAETVEPKGPLFKEQLKRLDELVRVAQTTLPVTIESDGLTEVIIYKVGKLGSFHHKEVHLRPGTYTIVGNRNGFKDVRQRVKVKAGQDDLRVTVQCSEKI
jgi:hypothetical protein